MSRRPKGLKIDGWVALDKPEELTSTDAVARIRRRFNAQKAGHAGTLDPLATGILPIALGEGTKTVPYLMDADKTYRFTVRFGEQTTTLDREGEVCATSDVRPTTDQIKQALPAFLGETLQTPPAYSAIRIDGKRAYDLARDGVEVEMKSRPVVIYEAELIEHLDADHAVIEITCGKGTYVRSLARDLAAHLGTVGYVTQLRRLRVGPFSTENAITLEKLDDLSHRSALLEALLPVETALDDIPALAITDDDAFRLKQGRPILLLPRQVEALRARLAPGERTVSAFAKGRLVALGELRMGHLEPKRIFQLDMESSDVDHNRP